MRTLNRVASFSFFLLTMLFCSSFTVEPSFDADYENDAKAEKIMSKEFAYNSNTSLEVYNTYGNVKISPWKSDKVRVDVYVKYDASITNKNDYASKSYRVEISQAGNRIKVETKHLRSNIKHTINYVIYAPAAIESKTNVKYGDIALGSLSGYVDVDLKYGDLYAEKLDFGNAQKANSIKAAYGDVAIKEVSWLNLSIEYGNFALQSGYALGINGSYSDFKIDNVKFVNSALSYSDLKFGTLNSIKGKLVNTDIKIDKLYENMVLALTYSNVIIYSVDENFKNIDLQGSYSDGKITFQNNASFKLNVTSKYSDFKLYNLSGGSQNFEGSFSKIIGSNPTKNVRIVSNYGDWTLRKN